MIVFSKEFFEQVNFEKKRNGRQQKLKTFANSLDPDQDRQNVGPDLDPNGLTI